MIDRRGLCLACHQEIPDKSLPVAVLSHVAAMASMRPETTDQHNDLLHKLVLLAAWVQVGGPIAVGIAVVILVLIWLVYKDRIKNWLRKKLEIVPE